MVLVLRQTLLTCTTNCTSSESLQYLARVNHPVLEGSNNRSVVSLECFDLPEERLQRPLNTQESARFPFLGRSSACRKCARVASDDDSNNLVPHRDSLSAR